MEKDQQRKKNAKKRGTRKGRKRKLNSSLLSKEQETLPKEEEPSSSSSSSSSLRAKEQEQEQKNAAESESKPQASFETAKPTLTHRAITALSKEQSPSSASTSIISRSIVQYVITQNVDGLHMRSGLSRSKHCFLHGCIFTEKCEVCGMEYFRDFDIGGVSFQKTGRTCTATRTKKIQSTLKAEGKKTKTDVDVIKIDCDSNNSHGENNIHDEVCGGDLRDTILDWEDELPEADWETAQIQCENSDLVLALGTSLRIEPAGSLPTLGEKFVIVNKQVTPYDSRAEMIIRAPVDEVFRRVMEELRGPDWDS